MEKQVSLSINLIKKKGTPSLDVLLHWAITGGRFIVIVTETIALAAFLYRFTLDRQIIDLHDHIKAKEVIVSALSEQEASYRLLQDRLIQAKALTQHASFSTDLFTKIYALSKPRNITVRLITVGDSGLNIEVTTGSVENLKAYVGDLQKQKELKDISIGRIEDRTTTAELAAEISSQVIVPKDTLQGLGPIAKPKGATE